MLKIVDNEVDIYKAEKKLNILRNLSEKPKLLLKKEPDPLEIEMLENRISSMKLFHNSKVIVCKRESYGPFPFQFNDKVRIIMMLYENGESIIFSYDDVEKVQIMPNYVQKQFTETTTRKKGGVTRAVLGGALFGSVGAVVGSATAGNRSSSVTTHYTSFNNYKFLVWLKSGECYFVSNIPSRGSFEKKPSKELLELEFYFLKVINESNKSIQIESRNNDANKENGELSEITREDYISSFRYNEISVKKTIQKQRVLKGILYVFISLILILVIVAFIALINDFVDWLNGF